MGTPTPVTTIRTLLVMLCPLLAACGQEELSDVEPTQPEQLMQVVEETVFTLTEDMVARCATDWTGLPFEEIAPDDPVWNPIKRRGDIKLTVTGSATAQCLCDGSTSSPGCQWDINLGAAEATCTGSCQIGNEGKACKVKLDILGGTNPDPAQTQGSCG